MIVSMNSSVYKAVLIMRLMMMQFLGLVQLEALESLFSSSETKVRGFVEMLPKESADPLKSDLMRIKQIFDAVEDGDEGVLQ